jgi:mannose-6-phosphate isomerase-like protein (cupin superfamily)
MVYGTFIEPFVFPRDSARDALSAYRSLIDAAQWHLRALDDAVALRELPPRTALHSRVRGTGPCVAFGTLIELIETGLNLDWQSPFEGSHNVTGAALPANEVLCENREDGLLFLRFAPNTQDLPLHIHPRSDRFIYVVGGRGYFHVATNDSDLRDADSIHHVPARDRDVFMFPRGTVHTFSTDEHPLILVSYHRPFVPLDEADQFDVGETSYFPRQFLAGRCGLVSFDAAWTACKPNA